MRSNTSFFLILSLFCIISVIFASPLSSTSSKPATSKVTIGPAPTKPTSTNKSKSSTSKFTTAPGPATSTSVKASSENTSKPSSSKIASTLSSVKTSSIVSSVSTASKGSITSSPVKSTSTSKSKASTSCIYVPKATFPAEKFCDVQGNLHKPAVPIATHPGKNVTDCLLHCLNSGRVDCHAFGLDLTINQCTLYNQSISNQDFQATFSNEYFWSRRCFEQNCTVTGGDTPSASTHHTTSMASLPASQSGTASVTASAPVTTISSGSSVCVVPIPLSAHDCKIIRVGVPASGKYMHYSMYFNGSGVVEATSNPGNMPGTTLPATTTTYLSSLTACDAATMCAGNAAALGIGAVYQSFDLHYNDKTCQWVCVAYGGYNANGTYFNVKDADAYVTYGFEGMLKGAKESV